MGQRGGRRPSHAYYKRRLGADAKIIIELLKKQPQTIKEICENAKINEKTFYSIKPLLEEAGVIKRVDGGYALFFYEPLERKIEEALIKLTKPSKSPFSGYATSDEIVDEVGRLWHEIESLTYKVAKKLGLSIIKADGETIFVKTAETG